MRKTLLILGIATGTFCLAVTAALACGDKLMVLGRGVRFQGAYAAVRPAAILIYMHSGSAVPTAIRDPQLQPALKQAGHKLQSVEDPHQLDEALKSGKYDLVLADISDASDLEQQAQSAPSRPAVLPVVFKPTKTEAAAAEKRYQCVLKTPDKTAHYLATIDEAMELRLKAGQGKSK